MEDDELMQAFLDRRADLLAYLRAIGSANLAEDAFQETYLVVQRRLADFRRDGDFHAWVRGIPRNVLRQLARRSQRVRVLADDALTDLIDQAMATVTVQRLGGSTGALVLAWSTAPGSAGTGDYTPASGTISWASGDSAAKTISVSALSDGISEGSERCRIVLASPAMPAGSQMALLISDAGGNQPPTISGVSASSSVVFLP
jgi:hypothetical protein